MKIMIELVLFGLLGEKERESDVVGMCICGGGFHLEF